jgi:hypothetical protein
LSQGETRPQPQRLAISDEGRFQVALPLQCQTEVVEDGARPVLDLQHVL